MSRVPPGTLLALLAIFALLCLLALCAYDAAEAGAAIFAGSYVPGEVVVKYAIGTPPEARLAAAEAADAEDPRAIESHTRLLRLRPGVSIDAALMRLRHRRGVLWAVPDYLANDATVAGAEDRTAAGLTEATLANDAVAQTPPAVGAVASAPVTAASDRTTFIPNDPGTTPVPGGWQQLQWNFVGPFGVNAPRAWANVANDRAYGGTGVIVAVLDTGVAYANRAQFRRSPDFTASQFVAGYDFVAHKPYANDRNGHGTHVAGTIAEATNNAFGLTGLAYGVRIMPVRVLDAEGNGEAATIAKGVRFAVNHGARVINMSLEFPSEVTAADIPELLEALRYAHRRGVVVVAAAGNEAQTTIAYPAHAPDVIAVGATTEHGCLANFSDDGRELTLVAPGGGPDADLPDDPNCHPEQPPGRDIYQETFTGTSPRQFGIPPGYDGTSMACPHVSATAALIIASGVLGRHPTPAQITARLRATARKLGGPNDRSLYGAGLVNAAAATAPGGPGALARRT